MNYDKQIVRRTRTRLRRRIVSDIGNGYKSIVLSNNDVLPGFEWHGVMGGVRSGLDPEIRVYLKWYLQTDKRQKLYDKSKERLSDITLYRGEKNRSVYADILFTVKGVYETIDTLIDKKARGTYKHKWSIE